MTYYAQRDTNWKDEKLGTSNTTIGSHGCLISCIGSLAGISPSEVNKRISYQSGNLVVWTSLSKIGLDFKKRVKGVYNNDEVKSNLPCLVEVDGKRIGAPKHWCLYLGDGKMWDPWYGNIKSTSYYPAIGYSIVKSGIVNESPPVEEDMSEITDSTKINLGDKLGTMEVHAIRSAILDGRKDYKNLEAKYKELLEKPTPGMTEEQLLGLGDILKKATRTQFEITNAKIKLNQDTLTTINNLQNEDRADLGTIKVNQQATLDEMTEFKGVLASQTEKIKEKVSDAVQSGIIDIGDKIKSSVREALTIFTSGGTPIRKKTFWERLLFWKQEWKNSDG